MLMLMSRERADKLGFRPLARFVRFAVGDVPTITPAWITELLRVIELDPHIVGVDSTNWTTGLLAT